eukprot:1160776-Pelagomonas_calceolata.AAC.3
MHSPAGKGGMAAPQPPYPIHPLSHFIFQTQDVKGRARGLPAGGFQGGARDLRVSVLWIEKYSLPAVSRSLRLETLLSILRDPFPVTDARLKDVHAQKQSSRNHLQRKHPCTEVPRFQSLFITSFNLQNTEVSYLQSTLCTCVRAGQADKDHDNTLTIEELRQILLKVRWDTPAVFPVPLLDSLGPWKGHINQMVLASQNFLGQHLCYGWKKACAGMLRALLAVAAHHCCSVSM